MTQTKHNKTLYRRLRLRGLLDRANAHTRAAWGQLEAAQLAFAKENEIKLK
jgi:hypothetical protein